MSARGLTASPLQMAATAVAAVFLLVGVLGFVPGITTDYGAMEFAGHESDAQLLGLFQVSVLHNLVHLAFGAAGLLLAMSWQGARAFLLGGGAIYLLLMVYGFLVDRRSDANFVPVDQADNWLHLVLGLAMIALALLLGRTTTGRTRGPVT